MVRRVGLVVLFALGVVSPGHAIFHLMQIEQVIGGICGDPAAQAIQLRMRFANQNFVAGHELAVYDGNGENRLQLLVFPTDVANGALGARILVATSAFATKTGITPDFILPQPIPVALLRAGKVTFEDTPGAILWALAWGGTRYLGSNFGLITNDPDGDFGPPVPFGLPWSSARSVRFPGAAGAGSTTNAADYALSAGPATFINNAGSSITLPSCLFGDGHAQGDLFAWSTFLGAEWCNGLDDDGDLLIDEDFPLGAACSLPGGGAGTYVCHPDGRGVVCS